MKFVIRRASGVCEGRDDGPCEGARRGEYIRTETYDYKPDKTWRLKGAKHRRIVCGEELIWARDFRVQGWAVDIDDLVAFADKYGSIVVDGRVDNHATPTVTIYDDYME